MKPLIIMLMIVAALPAWGRRVSASDSSVVGLTGRCYVDADSSVRFNYPGMSARLRFVGESLTMMAAPGSGCFVVEVDSLVQRKICFGAADSVMTIASSLCPGVHEARVTYCIEGFEFHPAMRAFEADSFAAPPSPSPLLIEYIGDSMTCGYGVEASLPNNHFSYDAENHLHSYAARAARLVGADHVAVCRSGIGIYRNYDGPRSGSTSQTMPDEYGGTLLYDYIHPWPFGTYTPDIICINLGTNDVSTQNYDISLYQKTYSQFLDRVRSLNPTAKIVLLTGPMTDGAERADLCRALDEVAVGRSNVYRFDMTPLNPNLGYGADWHPGEAQSMVAAAELAGFLRSIM